MATLAGTAPRVSHSTLQWLFKFLKQELAPFPGRGWTVARMTIAATVMMLWIMVFRIPGAALGAYYTLLFSRDSPQATLRSAITALSAVGCALCVVLFTAAIFVGDPVLHFVWVIGILFLAFFLISALNDYRVGTAFGFLAVTSLTYWDFPANTETRVENTLWTALAVAFSAVVTVSVEFVLQRIRPYDQLREGLSERITIAQSALAAWGRDVRVDEITRHKLIQYGMTGTAGLRRLVNRSLQNPELRAEWSALIALVGRLLDLAAALNDVGAALHEADRGRCLTARQDLQAAKDALDSQDLIALARLQPHRADASHPMLRGMQETIVLLPQVFAGLVPQGEFLPSAIDVQRRSPLWKPNAFSSPDHIRFALKGALAAGTCYLIYNGVDWAGLNTALATCLITAVISVGASRQKQFLRVLGALFGAVCLGMATQVFLLPHMASISEFTVLFVAVTALSSWIATSSARLSFAGLQTAFAFYITQLRTFGPQTSLTVARDDVAGILLGLTSMYLFFDRFWTDDSAARVNRLFIDNLRRVSGFSQRLTAAVSKREAVEIARSERSLIGERFDLVRNETDALFFEFGEGWQEKVKLRNQIRSWQPQLRTYFLLEVSLLHNRLESPDRRLPPQIESCVQKGDALLGMLADWREATLNNPSAEPPEAMLSLLATQDAQLPAPDDSAQSERGTKGSADSILNIAVSLAHAMLSTSERK